MAVTSGTHHTTSRSRSNRHARPRKCCCHNVTATACIRCMHRLERCSGNHLCCRGQVTSVRDAATCVHALAASVQQHRLTTDRSTVPACTVAFLTSPYVGLRVMGTHNSSASQTPGCPMPTAPQRHPQTALYHCHPQHMVKQQFNRPRTCTAKSTTLQAS